MGTALIALTVLPIVLAAIHIIGARWYSAGDWAMIELRTHDVGGSHTPLVGPYSLDGWNHRGRFCSGCSPSATT